MAVNLGPRRMRAEAKWLIELVQREDADRLLSEHAEIWLAKASGWGRPPAEGSGRTPREAVEDLARLSGCSVQALRAEAHWVDGDTHIDAPDPFLRRWDVFCAENRAGGREDWLATILAETEDEALEIARAGHDCGPLHSLHVSKAPK